MKKTTWLLLAISVVAMLLVAGCTPTTPAPTASPSPTPTATPTTPPADKECPKPVSTQIGTVYDPVQWGTVENIVFALDYITKLTITFNEPITSGCIEDPSKWDIVVKNNDRRDTELTETESVLVEGFSIPKVAVFDAELSTDGKKVEVYATVLESLSYVVKDVVYKDTNGNIGTAAGPFTVTDIFDGLICSQDDADDYATPDDVNIRSVLSLAGVPVATYSVANNPIISYTLVSGPKTPKVADVVEWKLKDCVVADELGNACCDYSDSTCCLEPTCAECEEGCPLGSEGSCL